MLAAGTTVWSPLFVIGAIVALVLLAALLIHVWSIFFRKVKEAVGANVSMPSWVTPVILTVLLTGGFAVGLTVAWNAMQDVTTSASSYQSKAEADHHRKTMDSNLPSNEQLDKAKATAKDRAEVQPHLKALDDFDAKMAAEAEKIRKRSLVGTTQPVEK